MASRKSRRGAGRASTRYRASAPPAAATYYISAAGNNAASGTTTGTAWQTVAKVNSTTLGPGATVLFRRGDTWTDAGLVVSNSGTSGNPITVGAYGTGAPPIFDGGGNSTTPGARAPITIVGNWVTINGIRAQHANWAGIDVTGDDAVIRYCYLTENINGVQVNDEASRTLITSCQFVSNSVLYVGPGPDDDTGAQGIAIGGLDTEVSYCSFLNHFTTGSPDFGNDGAAIEIFGAQNANIHHNKSVNDLIFSELGADATDNCVFHHNLVYSTRPVAGGINIHGTGPFAGVTGTKVLHNTIVLTAADSVAFVADGTADCELKNNILVAANTYTENPVNEAGNVINASSFQGINSSNAGGSGLASTSSTAAALVLGASTGNFAISPASPAIGRGVTTSLTFTEDFAGAPKQSISWDAGAYEYIVPSLSENFSTYSTGAEWTEGGILGAWRAQFLGTAGYARIVDNAGDKALELKATIGSGTTSTLLTSTAALHNGGGMKITGRMRTLAQTGAVPNDWEAAWLFFHYSDRPGIADQGTGVPSGTVRTCYYLSLKPQAAQATGGWELGKLDQSRFAGGQRFLASAGSAAYPIGTAWRYFEVTTTPVNAPDGASPGLSITVKAGNSPGALTTLVTFVDGPGSLGFENWSVHPTQTIYTSGSIGLYHEDAQVQFDDIVVTGPASPAVRTYPLHTNIISTTFWVGELFNPVAADGSQVCSTYDSQWAYRWSGVNNGSSAGAGTDCAGAPLGGCDGVPSGSGTSFACATQARTAANNYFPTTLSVHPQENPFYLDLPFDDLNDATGFSTRGTVIPWAADPGFSGKATNTGFSYMKNRWVKLMKGVKVCYAQIQDAGPGQYHDATYVFGAGDARPASTAFNNAGMDVSPAVNGYLGYASLDGESDQVSWQFVDAVDVPLGPWTQVVTYSQVEGADGGATYNAAIRPPGVNPAGSVKAFDSVNDIPDQAWFEARYAEGYRLYAMHSTEWPPSTAPWWRTELQLGWALAAGLKIAAYVRDPNNWSAGIDACGPYINKLQFFAIDIETDPGIPATRAMVDGIKARGVRPVMYSGSGMWGPIMGAAANSFPDVPLWDTNANPAVDPATWTANLNSPTPVAYGGWNTAINPRIMVQQRFEATVGGVLVDLNSVQGSFLQNL